MDSWVFSFITACLVSLVWPHLPPLWLLIILTLLILILAWRKSGFLASGFAAGTIWMASVGYWTLEWQLPTEEIRQIRQIEGRILTMIGGEGKANFTFEASHLDDRKRLVPVKLRLSWREPPKPLKQGQRWRLPVRLKPPHGFANEAGFDYQKWLVSQGIAATGYVSSANAVALDSSSTMRQRMFDALMKQAHRHGKWLAALSLGERSGLADDDWQLAQVSGISHLIAISGLHLGMVATFCYLLWRIIAAAACWALKISPAMNLHVYGLWLSLLASWGYAMLSGFALPACRAWVMASLVVGLSTLCRHWPFRYVLMYSLFLLLLLFPLQILSASFWLSFCAVISIGYFLWCWPVVAYGWRQWRKYAAVVRMQVAINVLMTPLVGHFFGLVSVISPAVNLVAVPFVTLILLPLCLMATLAITTLPNISHDLFTFADKLFALALGPLTAASTWQFAYLQLAALPTSVWLWVLLWLVLWILPTLPVRRLWQWVLLLPLVTHLLPPHYSEDEKATPEWQLDVLDVGQGLSVLLSVGQETMVYDVGPAFPGGFNMADAVITPVLKHRGISRLDSVIISHYDNDHAGSLRQLQSQFVDSQVVDTHSGCVAPREWQWQGLTIEVLWPDTPVSPSASANDTSCVLMISDGSHSVLLSGDISAAVEAILVSRWGDRLRADVLVAPHHGSNTSSSEAFVAAVSPRYVIFSEGFLNRWDFPRQAVVTRYVRQGTEQFSTSEQGQIQVRFSSESGVKVSVQRSGGKRAWYNR